MGAQPEIGCLARALRRGLLLGLAAALVLDFAAIVLHAAQSR
jgi:hypothetical protein